MSAHSDLELLLRARYPLLYIPTTEEERLEAVLHSISQRFNQRPLYIWDFVEGYQGTANDTGTAKRNPLQALEFIEKLPAPAAAIILLRDFHRFLDDIAISRKLRNLARLLKSQPKNLILLAPTVQLPPELRDVVTVVEFPLPRRDDIHAELLKLCQSLGTTPSEAVLDQLIRACQGLSLDRIRRVIGRAIALNGTLDASHVDLVLEEKRQILRQTQILDFYPAQETIADIGGLDNLKEWLLRRGGAFSERARRYGLPYPRGVLLAGIQGTGKSLTAKAIAHQWHLPLLRLDVGRLFGGIVGESEARTRDMIQITEALAPCVLWIDELDKAFAGIDSRGDGGASSRVFGTIITWLAEKTSAVFVVATANNIQVLPPELLRKGRFDEIFFVGLPSVDERRAIFEVHLSRVRGDRLGHYDLDRLAYETIDFSGAEIEQCIIEAMHLAFSQDRDFTTEDLLHAASEIIPLARTAREQVHQLQEWAASGRARFASRLLPSPNSR